jgi:hypothetical protein
MEKNVNGKLWLHNVSFLGKVNLGLYESTKNDVLKSPSIEKSFQYVTKGS